MKNNANVNWVKYNEEGVRISGNRECGLQTQEEWDQMMFSDCAREEHTFINSQNLLKKNVDSQQECAQLSASTPGGIFWEFNRVEGLCSIKASDNGKVTAGSDKVVGTMECGLIAQEKWTEIMGSECSREIDTCSTTEPFLEEVVDCERACAELAGKTPGGLFWVYNRGTGKCNVKKNGLNKVACQGRVTGNRECGLMPKESWDKVNSENCATPEERDELANYLGTPENCLQGSEETTKTNVETEIIEQKAAPIIDLFLNPNRSDELDKMMSLAKEKGSVTTKVRMINQYFST